MSVRGILSILCIILFSSCGIMDSPRLMAVSERGSIIPTMNTSVDIRLPSAGGVEEGAATAASLTYFTHFAIYYRIYISDEIEGAQINTDPQMSRINSALLTHYKDLDQYTYKPDNTGKDASSISSEFSNRKYYTLNLEGAEIETVLGKNSLGKVVKLAFDRIDEAEKRPLPVLTIDSTSWPLRRSNGSGAFNPLPENRRFINDPELYSRANASPSAVPLINNDVADNTAMLKPEPERYTYASMYIVAVGINIQSGYQQIFSKPTHIGIFFLPK